MRNRTSILLLLISSCTVVHAQQVADLNYMPKIAKPMYESGKGTIIYIDEGHYNFHTRDGRYKPFAGLLERDGYVVKSSKGAFETEKLAGVKMLVIANALNKVNSMGNWWLPTPSAFNPKEIAVIDHWVKAGGSLFLIADHMPWPGAAAALANLFGFTFFNGFTINVVNPSYFWRSNHTIAESPMANGRDSTEMITSIPNTEGQAFSYPADAKAILLFDKTAMLLLPDTAWQFNSKTPIINIGGWAQLAAKHYGKGRVVVCGEASMFSAQIGDPGRRKMGMNRDDAPDNYRLLLNIIHWMDGKLDK
jgi:hypothetical protein